MLPGEFHRLLADGGYKIAPSRWPMACCAFIATSYPAITRPIQKRLYYDKAQRTAWAGDPIFVIGHWRTGTTLLHELLTLDERFAAPNTFQCFNPLCFLVTEPWLRPLSRPFMPRRRPMDNMEMGWHVAQEDEFALMTMGLPTVYRRIAFPNTTPRHLDYLNMNGVPKPELDRWKEGLATFMQYLNFKYRRPMVLKSPPHTGRIRILRELYPNARFVHIARNPMKFVPSTIHLWRALANTNGFQRPKFGNEREYVFMCYKRMYDGFERDRHTLSDRELVQVRFEDLVREPESTLAHVYEQLELGDFSGVGKKVRQRMDATKDYQKNKHELPDDLRQEILEVCKRYIGEFGYTEDLAAA